MKTNPLLTLLAAALFLAASPSRLSAADGPRDYSPFAPLDASTVLRRIELKVATAQYEKVLTALYDAQLTLRSPDTELTDEARKQADLREATKVKILEDLRANLREQIAELIAETNAENAKRGAREPSADGASR